jgi:predicted Zn-dependent protease
MKEYFYELMEKTCKDLKPAEHLFGSMAAEESDFCRINQAKVRQIGRVHQAFVSLMFVKAKKSVFSYLNLSFDFEADLAKVKKLVGKLRDDAEFLPEDPYLTFSTEPFESNTVLDGKGASTDEILNEVLPAAQGTDMVGFLANGFMYNACYSSMGHKAWFMSQGHNFGWSLYASEDKAVKATDSGVTWSAQRFRQTLENCKENLTYMRNTPVTLKPGEYKVYLEPSALKEIVEMLCWGGFSAASMEARTSPLLDLHRKERKFSPMVTMTEDMTQGVAPRFSSLGFMKKEKIPLIEGGLAGELMTSPRTAKEYNLNHNGVSYEAPDALVMAGGGLDRKDVLAKLGTGILVGNLWYLNISDRKTCSFTGMTRFGTFWVENGKLVAPINVMRFDDSAYRLLGENLIDLSQEQQMFLSSSTYGQRSRRSTKLPGALIEKMKFTL